MKSVLRIIGGVVVVIFLLAAGGAGVTWMAANISYENIELGAEEKHRFQTDAFSVEIPSKMTMTNFTGALLSDKAYIVFQEVWTPVPGEAETAFSQLIRKSQQEQLRNVRGAEQQPAVIHHSQYPEDSTGFQPVISLVVGNPHGQTTFFAMALETPSDPAGLEDIMLKQVRDFLKAYKMDDGVPGAFSGFRTQHGAVSPGPREGYIYMPNFVNFNGEDEFIELFLIPEERKYSNGPGFHSDFKRVLNELQTTGYFNGYAWSRLTLGKYPGDETIKQVSYFSKEDIVMDCEWHGSPGSPILHGFSPAFFWRQDKLRKDGLNTAFSRWRAFTSSIDMHLTTD